MTEEQMSEALDAIHDEALKLARRDDLTEELSELPEIMAKKIVTKSSLTARWLCAMRLGLEG